MPLTGGGLPSTALGLNTDTIHREWWGKADRREGKKAVNTRRGGCLDPPQEGGRTEEAASTYVKMMTGVSLGSRPFCRIGTGRPALQLDRESG